MSQKCYHKLLEIINDNDYLKIPNLGEIYLKTGENYKLLNDHRNSYGILTNKLFRNVK